MRGHEVTNRRQMLAVLADRAGNRYVRDSWRAGEESELSMRIPLVETIQRAGAAHRPKCLT